MRKSVLFSVLMSLLVLFTACGGDDEPSGGENGSSGGSSSGKTDSHEYVDLGLTSGTLWATCNVGASSPYEAGSYFAWGETSPKQDYSLNSYKWYNSVTGKYTKYCTNSSYGDVDNKTELDLADDAAYVNWGAKWRMPSRAQFDELRAECDWQWNGSGYLVTSKKNNKTLILPAAGYRWNGGIVRRRRLLVSHARHQLLVQRLNPVLFGQCGLEPRQPRSRSGRACSARLSELAPFPQKTRPPSLAACVLRQLFISRSAEDA